ncbi:MAG: Protein SrpB [Chroococcidiopsis cubana SAG 39.79]|uniref:MgtC/SapB transporter n=2 Tax=Chroococcidiopsis TaxID=54298 RepID=K9U3S6_CHRTP|nr:MULTISPECIES: MgtC/SapB family protein [Chroococcidiopsis]MBE9019064.1 MgtC/SapB family protein [Chroococcidiopsidales cyanobacterium LEGE 13417]PSB47581.1 MgtC/SapB family protein [Cyanosarcina cf. burmensis CCALA 770]AFY89475.1 MgtC/SapB transporter [Chroococcidiopsis thermalis PCC 7203]MDZ4878770.1 Protein SrpB [Chroococcidiopsis cubana SAG 39.79]PSB64592.1 MgtC/SapB family protein [Chroococcidiopsis cubana CCALA 043]
MTNISFAPDDWLSICFRLAMALVFGAILGVERQIGRKPAGLRTHMLVSLGSALLIMLPLQIVATAEEGRDAISRVIQGIAAGVGFIGAGEILRETQSQSRMERVRGLTSAAATWVSAGLGIAAGCGLWQTGLVSSVLALIVLTVFKRLEQPRKG